MILLQSTPEYNTSTRTYHIIRKTESATGHDTDAITCRDTPLSYHHLLHTHHTTTTEYHKSPPCKNATTTTSCCMHTTQDNAIHITVAALPYIQVVHLLLRRPSSPPWRPSPSRPPPQQARSQTLSNKDRPRECSAPVAGRPASSRSPRRRRHPPPFRDVPDPLISLGFSEPNWSRVWMVMLLWWAGRLLCTTAVVPLQTGCWDVWDMV